MGRVKIPPILLETLNKRRQRSRSRSRDMDKRNRGRKRSRSRSRGYRSRSRGRRSRSRGRRSRSRGRRSRSRGRRRDRRSRSRDRHKSRKRRVRSHNTPPEEEIDLDKEILRRERESAVVTSGRDYARRVVGYDRMLLHPVGTRLQDPIPRRRTNRNRRNQFRSPSAEGASPKREALTKALSQETRNRLANLKETYGELKNKPNTSNQSDTIRLGF